MSQKRASQGKSIGIIVRKKALICKEFNIFMSVNENKTERFLNDCQWFNIIQFFKSDSYWAQSVKCFM